MNDRYKPTSYHFEGDGIKACVDEYDHEEAIYWRVYFNRITTSDSPATIGKIEQTKFETAEYAHNAIERMIQERAQ